MNCNRNCHFKINCNCRYAEFNCNRNRNCNRNCATAMQLQLLFRLRLLFRLGYRKRSSILRLWRSRLCKSRSRKWMPWLSAISKVSVLMRRMSSSPRSTKLVSPRSVLTCQVDGVA